MKLFKCYAGSAPLTHHQQLNGSIRWSALVLEVEPAAAARVAYDVYLEQHSLEGEVMMPFRVVVMLMPADDLGHVAEPSTTGILVAVSPTGAVAAPSEQ